MSRIASFVKNRIGVPSRVVGVIGQGFTIEAKFVARILIPFHVLFIACLCSAVSFSAAAPTLPPAARDHTLFAQINDSHIPDPSVLLGQRAYIWGAHIESVQHGIYGGSYYPSMRDLNREHDLAWFQKNHPDWVVYKADRKTPAYDFVYPWGAYIPLDISRDDVRQYIFDTYLKPAIHRGFPAISYDNVSISNRKGRSGVWRDGKWVQLYDGDVREPAYAVGLLDYIKWVRDHVHAEGAALALNAKLDALRPDLTWQLISLGDIWLDEGGFSHAPHQYIVDQVWKVKFDLAARKGAEGGGYVSMNTIDVPLAQISPTELSWIVANFLLVRGPHSYLAILGKEDDGKFTKFPPSMSPPLGAARAAAQKQGACYVRPFANGWAIVNPSSKETIDYTVPVGSWIDLEGKSVSGAVKVAPHAGLILIKAP